MNIIIGLPAPATLYEHINNTLKLTAKNDTVQNVVERLVRIPKVNLCTLIRAVCLFLPCPLHE
jgi:hypothetical protein